MARGRPRKSEELLMKSAEMIGWAIGGIEREIAQTRERLSNLNAQAAILRARAGARVKTSTTPPVDEPAEAPRAKRKRPKMSAEAKKRISVMMKKRWAERKREAGKS
jgi:hypothetical protein